MSMHKSLSSSTRLRRERNVLTRWERIARLKEEEQWQEGRSVFALPKVKVARHKRHKKAKKEAPTGEAPLAEGEVAGEAAGEAAAEPSQTDESK